MLGAWENDVPAFLKGAAPHQGGPPSFEIAFLRGQLREAAALVKPADPEANIRHALLYLGGTQAGDKELADTHWKALTAALAKGQREERLLGDVLSGRKSIVEHPPKRLLLDPRSKRVFLAVLAQRHPEHAKELLALATRLDFHRDAVSLCLSKVVSEKR